MNFLGPAVGDASPNERHLRHPQPLDQEPGRSWDSQNVARGGSWLGTFPRGRRVLGKSLISLIVLVFTIPALMTMHSLWGEAYTTETPDVAASAAAPSSPGIAHPPEDELQTEPTTPVIGSIGDSDAAPLPEPEPGKRRFVIVVPVTEPSPDLCKLTSSLLILGYPSPVIVNWGQEFVDHKNGWFGGAHMSKITGTLDYLDKISRSSTHDGDRLEDDDIVLVVDGYDIWFQLPPEILLQRYHEVNRAANARLAALWPGRGKMPMQQTIVVSSEKRCWPDSGMSNLHCDSMPESPLPNDLYGSNTDETTLVDPESGPKEDLLRVRPRFVNSGSIMGPTGDMKRYFRRTLERMGRTQASGTHLDSDQGVFAEVMGEQEIWRSWLREMQESKLALPDNEGTELLFENMEYSVGLDYTQQLFIPTGGAEVDGEIIKLNNLTLIAEKSRELGISPIHLKGVPEDVKKARNPLQGIKPEEDFKPPAWGDMPLYADFFTSSVPAALHHNANHLKERRVTWWDQMWYFPYLRPLLKAALTSPKKMEPLATVPVRDGAVVYRVMPSYEEKLEPRVFDETTLEKGLNTLTLESVCRYADETADGEKHWYDEVFRDGKGPLKL